MYLEHFGLNEAPFRITPHTEFFFSGGNRGATLEALMYAIVHDEGIVKVSGEVGSGKTMLCRVLMERLPESVAIVYLANPSLSRDDILYAIADELHLEIPANTRSSAVMRALQEQLIRSYGEGRQVVVLVDEAHAMPAETLEEIRLLSNLESNKHKLLQLAMFGQPELNDILARADMRQLKERITHNFLLEPLQLSDIGSYIEFRLRAAGYKGPMPFSEPAIKAIAKASLGLTRRINILADKSLLAAYSAGSHQVGPREARAAIQDTEFSSATRTSESGDPQFRKWRPALAGGALAVVALALWLTGTLPPSPFADPATVVQSPVTPTVAPPAASPAPVAAPAAESAAMPITAPAAGTPTGSGPGENSPPAQSPAPAPSGTGATTPAAESPPPVTAPAPTATSVPATTTVPPAPAAAEIKVVKSTPAPAVEPQATISTPAASANDMRPATKSPAAAAPGELSSRALDAGREWMERTADDRWFVQLLLGDASTTVAMEDFLRRAAQNSAIDPTQLRMYATHVGGGTRYGVIYGEYASRAEATAAVSALPVAMRVSKPFPRQVRHLR